jgi:hypothetical protein
MSEMDATPEADPLHAVADAMETAVQAAKEGAAAAKEAAEQAVPAANRFLSRFVYTTCYTLSYGIVFPTVFVARSVPKNNALVLGLIDGAQAAIDAVDEIKRRPLASESASVALGESAKPEGS